MPWVQMSGGGVNDFQTVSKIDDRIRRSNPIMLRGGRTGPDQFEERADIQPEGLTGKALARHTRVWHDREMTAAEHRKAHANDTGHEDHIHHGKLYMKGSEFGHNNWAAWDAAHRKK